MDLSSTAARSKVNFYLSEPAYLLSWKLG